MADSYPCSSTKESHGKSESAASSAQRAVCTADNAQDKFDASKYASQTAGLYRLKGVTLMHRGHTRHSAGILFEKCSKTNMPSKKFADKNGILYRPTPAQIHTSIGTSSGAIGKAAGPIQTVPNQGTPHECKTFTKKVFNFWLHKVLTTYMTCCSAHIWRMIGVRMPILFAMCFYTAHT